jgi:hypothetical protein
MVRQLLTMGSALLIATAPAAAQDAAAPLADPILTTNETFRASIERIRGQSGLWSGAMAAIHARGGRVLILTPDQVVVRAEESRTESFDTTELAEAAPVVGPGSTVGVVLVVVNLSLLESAHARRGATVREIEADLDRILIHEVYGHAVPYLLAGDTSGRCADPVPGQDPRRACSMRRENAVRAELGLGQRADYTLSGLALSGTR